MFNLCHPHRTLHRTGVSPLRAPPPPCIEEDGDEYSKPGKGEKNGYPTGTARRGQERRPCLVGERANSNLGRGNVITPAGHELSHGRGWDPGKGSVLRAPAGCLSSVTALEGSGDGQEAVAASSLPLAFPAELRQREPEPALSAPAGPGKSASGPEVKSASGPEVGSEGPLYRSPEGLQPSCRLHGWGPQTVPSSDRSLAAEQFPSFREKANAGLHSLLS